MNAIITRSVRLPNGLRLHYAAQGEASGLPVLLLHGFTDSWRSFETTLPHMPAAFRAIALSQRGHGDSERPETGYRPRDFADDLAAFLDVLGIERALIVGHSMGTQVAQHFTLAHPRRVLGLVLVGGYVSMRANPVVHELWTSAVSRLVDPVDPGFVQDFQASTLARPLPQSRMDLLVAESLKVPARVWRAACAAMFEDDPASKLHRIDANTLILWGDRDTICTRADQDALLAGIVKSRLIVYRGAGHGLHWEEPARVAGDIAAFASAHMLISGPVPQPA
jgi:pimeloyl-ACP methyl ester carboxylesterase